ncbi:MAG: hypothetical protein JNL33_03335 [Betaproteobacteria bacterium]|nr:hypothetical protein [Betaproteobacteria bacterium]
MNPIQAPVAAFLLATAAASPALAVSLGQHNDFEDGSTQGWITGFPNPVPPELAAGGPAGADDDYLRLTSLGGSGAGSRLVAIGSAGWDGDYVAAGVTALSMDVVNLGASDLHLRLLIEDQTAGGSPANMAYSSQAISLAAGSGWQTVVFELSADALTPQLGSVTTALQTAAFIRLYNSFNPGFPGDTLVSSLGVDNITAVPEPAAVTLTAAGLLLLTALAGRHSKAAGSRASPA